MNKSFSSDAVTNAIFKSIQECGKKSSNIQELLKLLSQKGIVANSLLQIFPDKSQKLDVFNILFEFYKKKQLCENEKLAILRELVNLNIKKKEICSIILKEIEFVKTHDSCDSCWALCDFLYTLKQSEFKDEYIKIALCKKMGVSRQMIFLLMGRLKDDCFIPVILNSLDDATVNGHALSALSNYPESKYDIYFTSFLNDKRSWVKKIAKKRLIK